MVVKKVVSGVSNLVGLEDQRRAMADPSDTDLSTQINRRTCDALATAPGDFASDWYAPAGFAQLYCKDYYDSLNVQPPAPEPPPFEGGQCAGVQYRVRVDYTRFDGGPQCQGSPNDTTVFGQGPISGVTVQTVGNPQPNGDYNQEIVVNFANGDQLVAGGFIDGECSGFVVDNVTVTRQDGQPDNCGDLPEGPIAPVPNYPNPVNPGTPVTVSNPSGDDFFVDITVNEGTDGRQYVTVEAPTFEVNIGEDGLPPELPEGPQGPVEEGDPVTDTENQGEQDDVLTPEEQMNGTQTIGYKWSLAGYPSNAGIVQGTNPDVFFSPLGNVQLKVEGEGGVFFSDNLPIRVASGSLIRSDASLKVTGVRYNKRPDVASITVTPLRSTPQDAS